jgi:hypothetical protein
VSRVQPFFEGTLAGVAGFTHIFIDNWAIALKAFPWLSPALLCGGLSAGRIAVAAAAKFLSYSRALFTAGAQSHYPRS